MNKTGYIKISGCRGFSYDQIGPVSIDFRLGNTFCLFDTVYELKRDKEERGLIHVVRKHDFDPHAKKARLYLTDDFDVRRHTKRLTLRKGEALCIYQGQFILGETMERLKLPGDLMGSVNGRTRFARAGLNVHTTAPSLNPLTNNRTALEISDEGEQPLVLIPGTKICQVSFIRCWGTVDENKGDYTKEQL